MSIQEARIKLKELLANPTRENKYAAAATLPEIIKEMPSLAPQIITFLKEEIINPNSEYNTKHIAIESITKIVKILPNLVQEIFDILKIVITNPYSEYNTKSEAVKSLADIVKVKPNLTQEVVNFLKSLIINFNNEYEIKAKAVENILEIIEVTPNLAQETFTFLKEIIKNPKFNYDVKIVAIENIVGIVEVKSSLAQETFSFLKLVITNFNINYNAKLNAIESIATIVEVKPNLAQEAFTFLKVLTMNPKTNIYIKTKAIESITEILEIIPSLAQEAFTLLKVEIINSNANYNVDSITKSITQIIKLKPILEAFTFLKSAIMNANIDKHVKVKVIKSIAEIVKAEPSLTQEAFTFSKAAIMNTNIDKHVKVKTIKSMAEIVKAEPSLTQEAFIFLKEVIVNSDIDYDIKEIAYYNIEEIVKVMPSLSFETFTFFKERITNHSSNDIGYNATRGIVAMVKVNQSLAKEAFIILRNLLSNLNNYHENIMHAAGTSLVELMELIPFCYKKVHELLKIIKLTWHKDFHNGLYIEATLTLHKITHHLTQEYEKSKNPEVIEWFTASFNELPNISETRIFLKEICKSILKSGVINEYESKFILSCIKKYNFTFTVSVNKEPGIEGKIIFEDRNYEIFTTDNSESKIVSLEEFATKLLAETDVPLAEQYKTHNPLFQNKGLTLKIAASDINYVSSIANENEKLSTETYLLSYAGDNKDKFVMLLEKRSVFGEHLIYKLDKDNHNFEKIVTAYPDEIDKDIEEQVFEELDFEKLFEYVVRNNSLNSEEEKQIFKHPDKLKFVSEIMKKDGVRTINLKLPKHDTLSSGWL